MKKILAIALVACMALSILAACQPATTTTNGNEPGTTNNNVVPGSTNNTTVPPVVADATYTYNTSLSIFPTSWNPHTYEESTAGTFLNYVTDGFYTFDYNEDETGFAMKPAMTTDEHPIDITSQYVGKYGIEEGDSKMVYLINLRDDLCWSNGDKITAYDYVESAKRLMNPAAQNYRADSLYSGDVVIYNAENYLKQGQSGWFPADGPYTIYTEDLDSMIVFSLAAPSADRNVQCSMRKSMGFPASYDAAACAAYLIGNYLSGSAFTADMAAAMEGKTMSEIKADPEMKAAWDALIGWWQTDPNEELDFFVTNYTYPEMEWENNVGIFALSDTELVYVLTMPQEGFYLKYGLPSGYLVHIPTYDACITITDGIYSSTYCTSVETTPCYGTYALTKFQDKKEVEFERNETWYGLKEGDYYQTTHINMQYVETDATRLNLLLEGKLDTYGLTSNDFEKYGKSDYTYYSEGASVYAITFNPNFEALKTAQEAAGANKNKTIITLLEFRKAMCFGLDRDSFTAATDPAGVTAYGIFSSQHITNPDLGIGYRSTEQAKDVLVKFWGLENDIGEGKLYADKDEAIDSLTGYNPEMAQQLFDAAYDKAIADGLMDSDDVVEICIGLPRADSTFYNNGYSFIVDHYTKLVKGTKLEGKLTFTRNDTLGTEYSSALQANTVDMLFGVGWTGMELNPYGLIMAYMTPQYQYDSATDYTTQEMTVKLSDGQVLTATVYDWYLCINGTPIEAKDASGNAVPIVCGAADGRTEDRLTILAGMEEAVLLNYCFIPMNGDAGAQLKGMQIKYYHEEYMYGMGFGGIKYMTYNYTDAEWDAYVAAQGGELNYT